MHLKLDELIRAVSGARNHLDLEKLSDDDLRELKQEFERISAHADQATELLEEVEEAVRR